MVATTQIHVFNGSGPTDADITGIAIRFKRADNNVVDANNPVPVPTAGTNYSWRKHTKLQVVTAPDNKIENLRYFTSGTSLGTGISHLVDVTAIYVQGSSADETSPATGTMVDSSTYTSGVPLTIVAGTVFDVLDGTSVPAFNSSPSGSQAFLVQQISVDSTAGPGNSGTRTASYRYDEL